MIVSDWEVLAKNIEKASRSFKDCPKCQEAVQGTASVSRKIAPKDSGYIDSVMRHLGFEWCEDSLKYVKTDKK